MCNYKERNIQYSITIQKLVIWIISTWEEQRQQLTNLMNILVQYGKYAQTTFGRGPKLRGNDSSKHETTQLPLLQIQGFVHTRPTWSVLFTVWGLHIFCLALEQCCSIQMEPAVFHGQSLLYSEWHDWLCGTLKWTHKILCLSWNGKKQETVDLFGFTCLTWNCIKSNRVQ